jgi:predicted HAD superfamily Cof-like phosphohydrolase
MTILFGNGVPGFPTGVLAHSRQTRRDEITKAYAAYVAAEEADDLAQIAATLRQLTDAVFTCSYTYNIPILQVFAEVHRSNLAKLVDGKVLRRADGKVLKPESWTPANIEPILFPQT